MKTYCKKNGMQDGPLLHISASIAGAFMAANTSTPPDVVMTRF
jgi:hypothetical protein